jgi:branched-subunit amino acid aminotransferase/4-amino-4-deoxychorismate lyase
MSDSKAFLNGQLIDADQLKIPAIDTGFVWGITVAEQLRTFGGKLFLLDQHLDRFFDSLAAVGTQLACSRESLGAQARELAERNHALLASGDDLGLAIFATPGSSGGMGTSEPLLGLHTYPLPFPAWADKYSAGQSLTTSRVRQIDASHWPPSVKCRSRMHYFLADREVQQREPDARALLLDSDGFVCEASTANLVAVFGDQLVSPQREKILPGVSLAFVEQLATAAGHRCEYRDMSPEEFARADEVLLTSTPFCLLPVCQLDGRAVGSQCPGRVTTQLTNAWIDRVGCDFRQQATKCDRKR